MNQCGLFSQEKVLEQDSYDWLLYKQIMVLTEGKHLSQLSKFFCTALQHVLCKTFFKCYLCKPGPVFGTSVSLS